MTPMKRSWDSEEITVRRFAPPASGGKLRVRNRNKETITGTIEELMNLYADSLVEFQNDPKLTVKDARLNAGRAWRAELPELTDLQSVLTYIALIAWGQRMQILEVGEAKAMMFMAQTQLTAMSKSEAESKARSTRKRRRRA